MLTIREYPDEILKNKFLRFQVGNQTTRFSLLGNGVTETEAWRSAGLAPDPSADRPAFNLKRFDFTVEPVEES